MSKPTPIYNRHDRHHSESGAALLAGMRGTMVAAAEEQPLPARFSAIPDPDGPRMIICDEQTGRSTKVGLFAYAETRKALTALFADTPTLVDVKWENEGGLITITPVYAGVDEPHGLGMVLPESKVKLGQRLVRAIKAGATHRPTGTGTNCHGATYALLEVTVRGRTLNADLKSLGF